MGDEGCLALAGRSLPCQPLQSWGKLTVEFKRLKFRQLAKPVYKTVAVRVAAERPRLTWGDACSHDAATANDFDWHHNGQDRGPCVH
jgi:hypothetical protein